MSAVYLAPLLATLVAAAGLCPPAQGLLSLTIDEIQQSPLAVEDRWQVYFDNTPISDMQLATLAREDVYIEQLSAEIEQRGPQVYAGMTAAAAGTALSSAGWALFGGIEQNKLPQITALSMAIGGLLVGLAGVILVSDAIQTPLQPHLAPTPRHRLSRDEVRRLVSVVNQRWYRELCEATPTP
jgi:hypothetical protein